MSLAAHFRFRVKAEVALFVQSGTSQMRFGDDGRCREFTELRGWRDAWEDRELY